MNNLNIREWQVRREPLVKNATVFRVATGTGKPRVAERVFDHTDIDADDVLNLAESGQSFFVMPEDPFSQKWRKLLDRFWINDLPVEELRGFARVVIENGDFELK